MALKILSKIKKFGTFCLDILFPRECLGCGQENVWLCEKCLAKIPFNLKEECPVCHRFSKAEKVCPQCQRKVFFDGVLAASFYDDPVVQKMIKNLKYNGLKELAWPLAQMMLQKLLYYGWFLEESWCLVPIPLHRKRYLERGYNQAELLALELQKLSQKPILSVLQRKYFTPPQADLSLNDRLINLKNVFYCPEPKKVKNKKILLIDDVFTTGTTLNEASKVLKKAGALEIWGLVVAK